MSACQSSLPYFFLDSILFSFINYFFKRSILFCCILFFSHPISSVYLQFSAPFESFHPLFIYQSVYLSARISFSIVTNWIFLNWFMLRSVKRSRCLVLCYRNSFCLMDFHISKWMLWTYLGCYLLRFFVFVGKFYELIHYGVMLLSSLPVWEMLYFTFTNFIGIFTTKLWVTLSVKIGSSFATISIFLL